jgi:hypothetical protein
MDRRKMFMIYSHTVGLTSIVSSILILLSQVFITATVEEIFSQRPVLVDLSKNYYVMQLKFKSERFSKGFYLSFDVQRVFVKNSLYFL